MRVTPFSSDPGPVKGCFVGYRPPGGTLGPTRLLFVDFLGALVGIPGEPEARDGTPGNPTWSLHPWPTRLDGVHKGPWRAYFDGSHPIMTTVRWPFGLVNNWPHLGDLFQTKAPRCRGVKPKYYSNTPPGVAGAR